MLLKGQIKKVIVFTIILLMINEIGKLYFYKVSVRNHKLFKSDRAFHQYNDTIDYLFMGHSRPHAGVDESKIKNGVQFCAGGETNVQTYYKLKHILEKEENTINHVVLPFGYATFATRKPEISTNSFYWKRYVDYIELGLISNQLWEYLSVELKSKLVPYYEYPYIRTMMFFDEVNIVRSKELFLTMDVASKEKMGEEIVLSQAENKNLYGEVSFLYLKMTVELLKQYHKDIIFIKYPVSKSYIRAKEKVIQSLEMNEEKFLNYINKNIDGTKVFDMEALYANRDDLFKDPQHMNVKGRYEFTAHLKHEIDK